MITIDESAYQPLINQLETSPNAIGVRLAIRQVGCSGLTYVMEFAHKTDDEDIIIKYKDITCYVDPKSMVILTGSRLEYKKEKFKEGFEFVNPNVSSECGCGESFYVG